MNKIKHLLILIALLAFGQTAWAQGLSGSGTEADPYLITSTADWNTFASNVNGNNNYWNQFLKLTADITVSEMVGTNENGKKFHGTFDGNGYTLTFNKGTAENPFSEEYCAPFRYIFGATIKNLHVAGTIYTSNKFAGVVGSLDAGYDVNLSYITACRSSLTINSSISGDGTHGGFAGLIPQYDSNIHFTDCLFDGQLLGSETHSCGGFVGWHTGGKVYFTNCLFAPASVTFGTDNSSTFIRLNGNYSTTPNFNHCYYKQAFGTAQGTNASDMDNTTLLSNLGATWEIINGKVVPVMPRRPLTGNGTEQSPYQIASATDWDNLVYNVNTYGETYDGKYFKLTDNISVTEMVGGGDGSSCVFKGIFDGDGNTITFNVASATEQYIAPFRRIEGATIKGVKLAGTVSSSNRFAGGIVAYAKGTSTVTNCVNSTSISTVDYPLNYDSPSNGGIVGMVGGSGTINISGCVFNGQMHGTQNDNWCGILGLCNSGCTANISNCFFAPEAVTLGSGNHTIYRNNGINTTPTNCYYTQTLGTAQGKQARTITGSNVTVENAGTPSSNTTVGVIGYGTGIMYNGTLYAGSGDVVSINVTTPEGYVIGTVTYTPEGGTATEMVFANGVYSFTMPDANVTINADLVVSLTLEIAGYGTGTDGYVLIASPVGTVSPGNVTNLFSNTYDLYRFNQAVEAEWKNYKATDTENEQPLHPDFTTLESGRGYLYANSNDVTLVFPGTPYSGNGEVTLDYTDDNSNEDMRGWNLVGNPFAETAYIDRPFYVMNSEGNEIIAAEDANRSSIAPMEGIFVKATENGETLTFTTEAPANNGGAKLSLNLSHANRGGVSALRQNQGSMTAVIDRAIVCIGEGHQLPKFQIRGNSTKLYIPQDNVDYAVVNADAQGEMPLNFKAKENGTYTITVNPENVEVGYLHLIDNMTGADVDLLAAGPSTGSGASYTFTAKTTDYESRFKLVFSANGEDGLSTGSGGFAYVNNGEIIITGVVGDACNASLQVIDVTGRIIIQGDAMNRVSTSGMTAGVYVLRLIDGNDVMTQKIIIR